jgi:hypothetical protein
VVGQSTELSEEKIMINYIRKYSGVSIELLVVDISLILFCSISCDFRA